MDHFFIIAPLSNFEWYWWLQVTIFSIGCPILFILFIIHLINVISDLCTSKRWSIRSTPIKSDLNYTYISTISLSIISIALFFWSPSAALLWMWKYKNCGHLINCDHLQYFMKWYILIATDAWLIAKQSMYTLFLFRLYTTYKGSVYEYKSKYLITIGIISFLWTLICCINAILFTTIEINYYTNISFAAHYDLYYPFWAVIMSGFLDILLSIIFIYLFVTPLKQITNKMCFQNGENIECINEMYSIGFKTLIITSMSLLTTLIFLLSLSITNTIFLLPVDSIINCICIMLVTPYYLKKKYYEKLCCLPIKCSNKWKMKKILPIKPIKPIKCNKLSKEMVKVETVTHTSTITPVITPYSTPVTNSSHIIDNNFDLVACRND